jgi:hypothetical protein
MLMLAVLPSFGDKNSSHQLTLIVKPFKDRQGKQTLTIFLSQ